jgi:hypothetical protein
MIDISDTTTATAAGLHWQVAQATSLTNVYIYASLAAGNTQMGMFTENGSGGFMSDVFIEGGQYGLCECKLLILFPDSINLHTPQLSVSLTTFLQMVATNSTLCGISNSVPRQPVASACYGTGVGPGQALSFLAHQLE